ncbi:unnamed protein product [Triticum turgidum subsp. durum]|uniref:Glycosyltransferase N-terminal domain-containing protein n=1 Tax=Triticum turgidum subsp. durum TaxID=4567 RepID=A0A9R0XHK4_TRITD|nr:unnamed protein product [Triticum turgidum subsp. durum]
MVLPFPAQGHVIPLMELSRKLAGHGVEVDFVNTEFNHDLVMEAMAEKGAIPDGIHMLVCQGPARRHVRPPGGDDPVEEDQVGDRGCVHELGTAGGHHGGCPCCLVLDLLRGRVCSQDEPPQIDTGRCS